MTGEGEDAGVVYCEMQATENTGQDRTDFCLLQNMYPGRCGYKVCVCITVYHSIPQYTTVHHSIPQLSQYTTVHHSMSQYTTVITVYHSTSQYTTVHHSISQYTTVCHSIPQYVTVYHSISRILSISQYITTWFILQYTVGAAHD